MNIDRPDASTEQGIPVDAPQPLRFAGNRRARKFVQKGRHIVSLAEIPASPFTDNERVYHHLVGTQSFREHRIRGA
jgi:hypothetical protein